MYLLVHGELMILTIELEMMCFQYLNNSFLMSSRPAVDAFWIAKMAVLIPLPSLVDGGLFGFEWFVITCLAGQ